MAPQQAEPEHDDSADEDPFVVELNTEQADTPIVLLAGELDIANVEQVRAVTAEALAQGARRLVFDLAGIEFIDSSGITALLEAVAQCDGVLIRQPSTSARRVIESTGLADILRIEP